MCKLREPHVEARGAKIHRVCLQSISFPEIPDIEYVVGPSLRCSVFDSAKGHSYETSAIVFRKEKLCGLPCTLSNFNTQLASLRSTSVYEQANIDCYIKIILGRMNTAIQARNSTLVSNIAVSCPLKHQRPARTKLHLIFVTCVTIISAVP